MKRKTIQQTLVFETVNQLKHHVTADEVYDELRKEHPNISRGTVYRNLNQLSKNGAIQKIEVLGGADCFDYQCHKHYHTRCLKCGQIFDVDMEYIDGLENNIRDTHGFEFSGYDIMFKGLCPNCAK